MVYDFVTRLGHLGTRMKDLHDNELVYSRDNLNLSITNFTPEKIDVELLQAYGIAILQEKWQDFVFDLEEIEDIGKPAEPIVGDTITWDDLVFRVSPLGDETFRYTTSARTRIRVHTRQVGK